MQPTLVAVAGPLIGSRIVLADPSMVVGRGQQNQIVVSDPSVSRHHCTITKGEDGSLKLVNHSSRGTLVNGQPVEEHVLRHEDLICLGRSEFVVHLRAPSPDPTRGDDDPGEPASVLLDRMKRGDGAAGEALMRRTVPALRRWAHGRLPRYARDQMDTEDLVQEAVLATLRQVGDFEPTHAGAFEAYLRRAVLNKVCDEIRRVARRGVAEELPDDVESRIQSPLEQAAEQEAVERYEHALEELRPADRVAIILRLEFQHSFAEMATGLGKPSSAAARMAFNRALTKLGVFVGAERPK